ncbi:MAG: glycosyltransferase family 9 protein [bacterium]
MDNLADKDFNRILLLWIGRLGDFIVATPLINAIRRRFPAAKISLLTAAKAAPLARLDPNIDEVLLLEGAQKFYLNLPHLFMAARCFDLAVDLNPSYSRASLFTILLSMAPVRVSFKKQKPVPAGAYTHLLDHDPDHEHFLDRYGRMAEFFGADYAPVMKVYPLKDHFEAAVSVLENLHPAPGTKIIGIHPGDFKKYDNRWPEDNFVEFTKKLLALRGVMPVYFIGPGEEKKIISGILNRLPHGIPYIMPQPAGVAAALLGRIDWLVCNNSGMLQLAAAMGTNTFSFDSRYNFKCWRPRGNNYGIESRQWNSCRDIGIEEAFEAFLKASGLGT